MRSLLTNARRRLSLAAVATVATSAVLLAGCSQEAPGEAVPALAAQLERVDAAVDAGRFAQARTAIDELVTTTDDALVAGALTPAQAERILQAAQSVLDQLPQVDVAPDDPASETPPTPDPSDGVSETSEPEGEKSGDDDESSEDEKGSDKSKGKGRGKN